LRTRFQREAESIARFQSPGIVQVYSSGEQGGLPFLVLEHVAGSHLRKAAEQRKPTIDEAVELVRDVAAAVGVAHSRGIVHRDLKPENILIGESGPKVTDFGLAVVLEEEQALTRTGTIAGTPSYMAPEQAASASSQLTPACDVFSLGVILYELLTGYLPFRGANQLETLRLLTDEDPVPPRRLVPAISPDLETVVLRCLRKEPSLRYHTATELADDLDRFLRDEPVLARPLSRAQVALRWMRQHPAIVFGTVCGLVGVSILVGTWASFTFRLAAEREQKELQRQEAQRNFEWALKAVNRLVESADIEEFGGHAVSPVQRELLERARTLFEEFRSLPAISFEVRLQQAEAVRELARVTTRISPGQAAADLADESSGYYRLILSEIVGDDSGIGPAGPKLLIQVQTGLAGSLATAGSIYRSLEQYENSRVRLREGIDIYEKLTEQGELSPSDAAGYVYSVSDMGWCALREKNYPVALKWYTRAIAQMHELLPQLEADSRLYRELGRSLYQRGLCYSRMGNEQAGQADLEAALEAREAALSLDPLNPDRKHAVGISCLGLGRTALSDDNLDLAATLLGRCRQLHEELVNTYPDVVRYQGLLAATHESCGILELSRKNESVAQQEWEKSVEYRRRVVLQHPESQDDRDDYRSILGRLLRFYKRRGMVKELAHQLALASETYDEFLKLAITREDVSQQELKEIEAELQEIKAKVTNLVEPDRKQGSLDKE
ncbi:MAG: serine/threonine protein kinase, partial [Planctomycetaceae bacterium]|nr:serine/threonine protein kinase [Planctomycetaceae bacterium]